MIDKTVEYKSIVMLMDADKVMTTPAPLLPQGFSFRLFCGEEDIEHWCRIETSVQEFDNPAEAKEYFMSEFYPYMDEMKKRCAFVLNSDMVPIATATGWYSRSIIPNRLHWVAVCPEYQGLGLGKAVSQKAINLCAMLAPNQPMWLSTQTQSARAVGMYHKLGFNMVKSGMDLEEEDAYVRDYDRAIEILGGLLDLRVVESLRELSV